MDARPANQPDAVWLSYAHERVCEAGLNGRNVISG
jgi:hypothetical protein